MSFSRLRRSCRYDDVLKIYQQVQENTFYARQVGLNHAQIGKLKAHGDIIEIKGYKQKIITDKKITYKVSLYKLSRVSIDRIEEDMENGEIPLEFDTAEIEEKNKQIISSETIKEKRKIHAEV